MARPRDRGPRGGLTAVALLVGGCNLVLGLEEASEIETQTGGTPCVEAAECNDGDFCTQDACSDGFCSNEPLEGNAPEAQQTEGDCRVVRCSGGIAETVSDDADLPTDGLDCTDDACTDGVPDNPPLASAVACTQGGGKVCDGKGSCVGCVSNMQCTEPETCGGAGTPNECGCQPKSCNSEGLTCGFAADNGCGKPLDCNNKSQDGGETDADCGGPVAACSTRCNDGKKCTQASDCANGVCVMGVCDSGVWSARYGDASPEGATAVAVDSADNVAVAGDFNGSIDLGGGKLVSGGSQDIFVAKLDTFGQHLWSKSFGDGAEQRVTGLRVDGSDNVIVAGSYAGAIDFGDGPHTSKGSLDVFVTKLDKDGALVWSRSFGDAQVQRAEALAIDATGAVIVAGYFAGTLDFGMGATISTIGGNDAFVAKLDKDGNALWAKRFGDASDQKAVAVAVDPVGRVIVAGQMEGSVDFGGGPVQSAGGNDLYLASLKADGSLVFAKAFGDASSQCSGTCPQSLATDGSANIAWAGGFKGSANFGGGPLSSGGGSDAFVVRLANGGGHLVSKLFGDASDQELRAIAVDGTGKLVTCGVATGGIDFGGGLVSSSSMSEDAALAKLDGGGGHVSSALYGDAEGQQCQALAIDSQNKAIVAGGFAGTLDLMAGPALVSGGSTDVWLAKLAP